MLFYLHANLYYIVIHIKIFTVDLLKYQIYIQQIQYHLCSH